MQYSETEWAGSGSVCGTAVLLWSTYWTGRWPVSERTGFQGSPSSWSASPAWTGWLPLPRASSHVLPAACTLMKTTAALSKVSKERKEADGGLTEMSDEPHHRQPNAAASPEMPPSAPPACSGLPSGTDLSGWWSHVSPQTQKIPCVRTEGATNISHLQWGSHKTGWTGSTTTTYKSVQLPEGLAWPWSAWCSRMEAGCTSGGGWSPALRWAAHQSAAPQSGSWKPWRGPGDQVVYF